MLTWIQDFWHLEPALGRKFHREFQFRVQSAGIPHLEAKTDEKRDVHLSFYFRISFLFCFVKWMWWLLAASSRLSLLATTPVLLPMLIHIYIYIYIPDYSCRHALFIQKHTARSRKTRGKLGASNKQLWTNTENNKKICVSYGFFASYWFFLGFSACGIEDNGSVCICRAGLCPTRTSHESRPSPHPSQNFHVAILNSGYSSLL